MLYYGSIFLGNHIDTLIRKKMKTIKALLIEIIFICMSATLSAQDIIPAPLSRIDGKGCFVFNSETELYTNLHGKEKKLLKTYINGIIPLRNGRKAETDNTISLSVNPQDNRWKSEEGYALTVTSENISIEAKSGAGIFYGLQTLMQLSNPAGTLHSIPAVYINDEPRFPYRGLMIDVSRHFFPKSFIMKQIDMLSYYKINRLHLHLTDGGGWRIEIKKYPKLTEETAYRPESDWSKWGSRGNRKYCKKGDPDAYGGYYTQKDIKEIVKYATLHHITVIPEIEMPGHSDEVLAAYPELACKGKHSLNADLCIGNEKTFIFMENVLKEIMDLFPSEYIHVGGDEADKSAWKNCPLCQSRMQEEHLRNVDELQGYMICRIEKFLNAHGRKLLGWDEIMEGKLAPDATVMSWRGVQGGIQAASKGHHAIMTPSPYCYLDYYQDSPCTEPKAIGGYLTLEKAYSYNPIPDDMDSLTSSYIDGVQGNLWTEYVPTPEHAEHMIYPRILAVAENGWSRPSRKSWPDFYNRALAAVSFLQSKGYHPFELKDATGPRPESLKPCIHEALGMPVTYATPYNKYFAVGGNSALTDGKRGDWAFGYGGWQGFTDTGGHLDVTVDMGKSTELHDISAEFLQFFGSRLRLPTNITISISTDGQHFRDIYDKEFNTGNERYYQIMEYGWKGTATGRYIRYQASIDKQPDKWLFTDEIAINKKDGK
jgi:hexosaminidase